MPEYTFADLIVNPETPGLESLIGKEVYFNDVPTFCIRNANDNYMVGILMGVHKGESAPFYVEVPNGCMLNYACIIPKKEESGPEYVPFESEEEFLEAFDVHACLNENSKGKAVLYTYGMWVRQKDDFSTHQVISIFFGGVHIGDYADDTTWAELLEEYEFLDGTPCGRLIEAEHE